MAVEIPYRRDFAFEYGRLEPVAPGVRRIVARNPGPFTFKGTGTYVVGEGEVAVIDPGPDLPSTSRRCWRASPANGSRTSWSRIRTATIRRPPSAVKEATGAPTYGFGPHAGGRRGEAGVEEGGDWDFAPDIVVKDGDAIAGDAGGSRRCIRRDTPRTICASRCPSRHPVQRRSCDGLVDQRHRAARRRHGGLYGLARQAAGAARRALLADAWSGDHRAAAHVRAFIAHRRRARGRDLDCLKAGIGTVDAMVERLYVGLEPRAAPRRRALGAGASDRPDRPGHRRRRRAANGRGALPFAPSAPPRVGGWQVEAASSIFGGQKQHAPLLFPRILGCLAAGIVWGNQPRDATCISVGINSRSPGESTC